MKTYIQPTTTIIAAAMQPMLAGSDPNTGLKNFNAKGGTVSENIWDDGDADDPSDAMWSKGVKVWGEDE